MASEEYCKDLRNRRIKLGYVADCDTCVQLVDSIGNQVFDLLPIIQAGETDTKMELLTDEKAIRYYPEEYTRTDGESGCYYDVCVKDLAALIYLNDLADVDIDDPVNGITILYNGTTNMYEAFDLTGALDDINDDISNLQNQIDDITDDITTINNTLDSHAASIATLASRISRNTTNIANLTTRVTTLESDLDSLKSTVSGINSRLAAIESAIYNWSSDTSTKIPRGNINITSGGYSSGNGIYTRSVNQNNDLDFQ